MIPFVNKTANLVLAIMVILIIYLYTQSGKYEVVYVKSKVNGKEYLVRNLEDKEDAADLLARLNIKLEKLVNYLSEQENKGNLGKIYDKYIVKDDKKHITKRKFKEDVKRLVNNFNPDEFSESTPDAQYTSYSVNKGEKIVFCLRAKSEDEKINEKLTQENIMMFVALHELGHLMTKSVGHEPEFWDNFKILLKVGIDINVYQHIDFNKNPKDYCGTKITDTPHKI